MQIIQVADRKSIKQFHDTIRVIYKDDPNFVCPLDNAIERILTLKKTLSFVTVMPAAGF